MILEEILIDSGATALVVIDAVNDMFADWGRYSQMGWEIKSFQEMAEKSLFPFIAESKGKIPLVFVRSEYEPNQFANDKHAITDFCVKGTTGADFYQLNPKDAAYICTKHQHSAFLEIPYEEEKATQLHEWLHGRGISGLIIAGVTNTNCIPTNIKHALQLKYKVIVPSDCIASRRQRQEEHIANLRAYKAHREISVVDSRKIKYRI